MAEYVTKLRTSAGDLPIDFNALANKPTAESLGCAAKEHAHAIKDVTKLSTTLQNLDSNIKQVSNDTLSASTRTLYGLSSSAVADDVFVAIKSILDTKIAVAHGSYVGTGKFGDENPNKLEFNFKPLFVVIQHESDSAFSIEHKNGPYAFMVRGIKSFDNTSYNDASGGHVVYVTWQDKAVQWYCNNDNGVAGQDENDGYGQLNALNNTYYYFAVGYGAGSIPNNGGSSSGGGSSDSTTTDSFNIDIEGNIATIERGTTWEEFVESQGANYRLVIDSSGYVRFDDQWMLIHDDIGEPVYGTSVILEGSYSSAPVR